MIQNLEINNFKSMKNLHLNCAKINLLIGEPNTGKSNILEALGLLSIFEYGTGGIRDSVRMESMVNLFYQQNLDEKIAIKADNCVFDIKFERNRFVGNCSKKEVNAINRNDLFSFDFDELGNGSRSFIKEAYPVKFYKFSTIKNPRPESEFLLPPSGENLFAILRTHKNLMTKVIQLFETFKLKFVFEDRENKIKLMEQIENYFILYPYLLTSDTLQRIVFYITAINSNKDSILVFEEPESNTFPYYTKFLGENIAFDKTNQYFIVTHNPYLLTAILEKTKKDDIGVFITYTEDFQTKIKRLTDVEISELMNFDIDPFFNLNQFIERNTRDSN
jgi:AAA15 family ATPase/GTPase